MRNFPFIRVVLVLLFLALAFAIFSCASTSFYRRGVIIAHFEGDMTDMSYYDDGTTIRWRSNKVDHSTATTAQGEAASKKIATAGTAVMVSGLTTLVR